MITDQNLASVNGDSMINEHNLTVGRFDGTAYESSQAAELALNMAILSAEIARSYEEFLEIFETFYADDVDVSSDSRETIRERTRIRPFLLNFLVPLHVMAEVAGKLPDCRYQFSRLRFLETLPTRHIPHGGSTSPVSEGNGAL